MRLLVVEDDVYVNSQIAENNQISILLPSMIAEPINVRTYITFKKAGIYRIVMRLNASTVYLFNITII